MIVPEDLRVHMLFAAVFEPLAIVPCIGPVQLLIYSRSFPLSLVYLVFLLHSRLAQKHALDMPRKNMAPTLKKQTFRTAETRRHGVRKGGLGVGGWDQAGHFWRQ